VRVQQAHGPPRHPQPSTRYPTPHPPSKGRAKRCPRRRLEEPCPQRFGQPPTRPTRRPKRGAPTWYPTHPPDQGRAKRRPGWRSREPGPSRSGRSSNSPDPPAETKHSRMVPHIPAAPGTSEAMFRLALQRTRPFTIGSVPSSSAMRAEARAPLGSPRTKEKQCPLLLPFGRNEGPSRGTPSLAHPGTGEAMSRLAPQRTKPSTIGTVPATWPKPPPRGWRSTWCPTHSPAQGRAKRRSGWRSREPRPSRLGLSPQRSPSPSSDRAPHVERAGVGAGAVRGRRGGQAPWRRARAASADGLAREGGWVGEG